MFRTHQRVVYSCQVNTFSLPSRLLTAFAEWLLRLAGGRRPEPAAPPPLPTHLMLGRDRRGRFLPQGYVPPPPGSFADEFLAEAGITRRMAAAASVPFQPPDDPEDIEQLQRRLREYVVYNLDHWVRHRCCSIGMVVKVLMETWAINRLLYSSQLALLRAEQRLGAADGPSAWSPKGKPANATTFKREDEQPLSGLAAPCPDVSLPRIKVSGTHTPRSRR